MGVGATVDAAVMAGYAMFAPQADDAIELQIDLATGGLQKIEDKRSRRRRFQSGYFVCRYLEVYICRDNSWRCPLPDWDEMDSD